MELTHTRANTNACKCVLLFFSHRNNNNKNHTKAGQIQNTLVNLFNLRCDAVSCFPLSLCSVGPAYTLRFLSLYLASPLLWLSIILLYYFHLSPSCCYCCCCCCFFEISFHVEFVLYLCYILYSLITGLRFVVAAAAAAYCRCT